MAGAGHWRAARRDVQDTGSRMAVCSASLEQKMMASEIGEVRNGGRRCRSSKMEKRPQRVLGTSLLMKTHHVRKPSDLCAADVSDRGLTTAQWEEFQQFTCLAYINASENTLQLEAFRTFPALRELDLSMNGIHRITVTPGEFPKLEVLDLSYNSLFPGDISHLGVLPHLRVLCLTGNSLTHLPPDLSAPPVNNPEIPMFPNLQVLKLDDNLLSDPSVFTSMATLQQLRLLNLDKNAISAIPDLSGAVRNNSIRNIEPGGVMEGQGHIAEDDTFNSNRTDDGVDYLVLHSTKDTDRTEVIFPSPRHPVTSDRTLGPLNTISHPSPLHDPLMSPTESALPPLPSLRTLSLADNKICHEEDVLPVALFPSLEELIINGNPLTTLRKGDPPLLWSFLQQRLGIKVIRKKSQDYHKPHLVIPRKEKRKVTTHIPKIPKQPLMLESLLAPLLRLPHPEDDVTESAMSSSPLPPIRTSSEESMDTPPRSSQGSEEEISSSGDPAVESVFMTQVDNIPDSPHIPSPRTTPEEQDTEANKKAEPKSIPEKFRGYEELYHVTTDPAFMEPVGIQNNVRALEYALRHLLVYRDNKPRLHNVHKPYVPQESKFGSGLYSPPWKSKKVVAVEILRTMKERRHLLEVPLDSALLESRSSKEHKEAKLLLKELQKKYQLFHKEAVKRATEVEAELRDTARQLLQAQGKASEHNGRPTHWKS
ncbi:X-ray radiation resistance-associated protein 1 [Leptodactylus fuscus]